MLIWINPAAVADESSDRCAGRLGTSRIIEVDVAATGGIGSFQFGRLVLKRGDLVLTFDDGPAGPSTRRILNVLDRECVRATFFMIGRKAEEDPLLARRIRHAGHTVASHTYSHPDLTALRPAAAKMEIVKGHRTVERAAYGRPRPAGTPRFVRFPEFRSNPALERFAADRSMTIVSADISPKDWRGDPPRETLDRLMKILETNTSGIVVLHDSQMNTARMLPMLFAEMKARGMRIVHIVPK